MSDTTHDVHSGYMLLRLELPSYRGVDRAPFEPLLLAGKMAPGHAGPRISDFYGPGWRREAYALWESGDHDGVEALLRDPRLAARVLDLIPADEGAYELCYVVAVRHPTEPPGRAGWHLLGYDVAYFGGDFYSAIRRHLSDRADVPEQWRPSVERLNSAGLFDATEDADRFRRAFIEHCASERDSESWIWAVFGQRADARMHPAIAPSRT